MATSVSKWLVDIGLAEYDKLFSEQQIVFEDLPLLTETDLKELGIPLGPRKRILKSIATLENYAPVVWDDEVNGVTSEGLSAWERLPGERKPVTMLFADIVNSTALTEQLDPEEAHDLLYSAIQRMCQVVENNRGTICRFMGDGVMAMFGAPVASERHAIDGCTAALAMQQAVREHLDSIDVEAVRELSIRVGLHSGEVVVLTVGDEKNVEYDASGPTVAIAARMEQSAPPGGILITEATRRLAEKNIVADLLTPVAVKGIIEPVPVFALRQVKLSEDRKLDATRTRFIGRKAELSQFSGLLTTCLKERQGQVLHVRGEPGIGKTRLVEEFMALAAYQGFSCHRVLVLPFGVEHGQDTIGALVRSLLDITDGKDAFERFQAADATIESGLLNSDQRVYLNDLLDLEQPTELRTLYDAMDNATRNKGKQGVVSRLLSRASAINPVLVVVEDVHWAETMTLAHLSTLARTACDYPALLVMTSRIEGDPIDRTWLGATASTPFVMIELGPLRKQESIELISEFIDTDDPLAAGCLQRASGNPLFLEQLLQSAQENATQGLPDSIQSLILARVDWLDDVHKKALRTASVLGQRFGVDALQYLLDLPDYDCTKLVEHNLIRPEGTDYLFAHALIQEAVYGSLLKRQRADLHRKAAVWFTDSDLVLHAEHLAHAADDAASEAFLAAAREKAQQYRLDWALDLVHLGLECADNGRNFELHCLHGQLLREVGSVVESIVAFEHASALAQKDAERCRAGIGIAEGLRITERYDAMLELLESAETIACKEEMFPELARMYHLRSNAYFIRGDADACLRASTKSLKYARKTGSPELVAQALGALCDAEYSRGHMISAHKYVLECLDLCREHGLGRILGSNLAMLGSTTFFQNRFQEAEDHFRAAIDLAGKVGQLRAKMTAMGSFAFRLAETVELEGLDEATELASQATEMAQQLGTKSVEAWGLLFLTRTYTRTGRRLEAESSAREALAIFRQAKLPSMQIWALGSLAVATTNVDQRRAALREADELLAGSPGYFIHHEFFRDAMEACLETGDWDEVERYAQAFADSTSEEPVPWSDFLIARGRVLAAFGQGRRDAKTQQELQLLLDEAKRIGFHSAIPALKRAVSNTQDPT